MKKYFYLFVAFVAMITFTACSNENEPKAPDLSDVIEKEIVGNYGGNLQIKVDGTELPLVPQEITIKKGGVENSISLSIVKFSFGPIELGDINLENCPVSGKDGNYTFTSEEPFTLTTEEGFSAVVNLKSGTIVKEEITLVLDIDATIGEIKQKVEVTYTGKRGESVGEDKSNEAKITSFTFDSDYENHPMHKVLVGSEAVIDESIEPKTITFKVDKDLLSEEGYENALKELYPSITVSEKATYSPTEGFDFSNPETPVKITVTAEDGETTAEYTVIVNEVVVPTILKNNFEEWKDKNGKKYGEGIGALDLTSYKWSSPVPESLWASANEGVAALKELYGEREYTMSPYEDSSVRLITLNTKECFGAPVITPGILFTGSFHFAIVFQPEKQLELTHFGVDFKGKPKSLKVKYKYTPGSKYIDGQNGGNETVDSNKDKGMIVAVLFDPEMTEKGWLDGTILKNKEYHVMSAYVEGEEGISNTNGEWKSIEVPFIGENYDSSKKYKLALVCQSSINGDKFQGAENSELIIDDIEVIAE